MQSLVTFFFERGSFGAFVVCLILFGLAIYLTYFRKSKKTLTKRIKKNKQTKDFSLPIIIISVATLGFFLLIFYGYLNGYATVLLLPLYAWFIVYSFMKKKPTLYQILPFVLFIALTIYCVRFYTY